MEKISWANRVENEEVLRTAQGVKRTGLSYIPQTEGRLSRLVTS